MRQTLPERGVPGQQLHPSPQLLSSRSSAACRLCQVVRSQQQRRSSSKQLRHLQASVQPEIQSLGQQREGRLRPAGVEAEVPCLAGAGGGIFFFWQLGAVRYLHEHYDLKRVDMVGASAGALVATVAACDIIPERAVESAYRMAVEAKLWDRRLGLLGIWGNLIRRWLDEILPKDAHLICQGRLKLVVTDVLARKQVYVEDFSTRQDLIDANMASIHIPLFLDFSPFSFYKRRAFVDGSLQDFLFWENGKLLTLDGRAFVLDYSKDTELSFSRLDFVKLRGYESVLELMDQGYKYAARVDADQGFERYFGSVRLEG